jgi:galactokinase
VTEDGLRAQFVEAGFDEPDADGRARLTRQALEAYARVAGGPPRWAWFVPGRIEVFGKHTDYAGGRSLLAAVPRGFVVAAAPRDDRQVRVTDARWRESVWIDPADESAAWGGWASYAAVVARRLARDFPGAALGTEIALVSDLPRAAGLSSSSALVVAMATALVRRAALDERPEWRAALATRPDLAGYLGAVENGLTFRSFAGAPGVGTHGGSEDHTAILLCRAGCVSAYSYLPVRHHGDERMPDSWRFLVASSGVQAAKAGAARDRYNRASLGTRALLDLWNAHAPIEATTLASVVGRGPAAIAALGELIRAHTVVGFSARELDSRLQHFVAEDARIPAALLAFRDADRGSLASLAAGSQRDADLLLGNQVPETRDLVRLAGPAGAFAATSFGAGFGGSVWALADGQAAATATAWMDAYRRAYPRHDQAECFVCRPAPPMTEIAIG